MAVPSGSSGRVHLEPPQRSPEATSASACADHPSLLTPSRANLSREEPDAASDGLAHCGCKWWRRGRHRSLRSQLRRQYHAGRCGEPQQHRGSFVGERSYAHPQYRIVGPIHGRNFCDAYGWLHRHVYARPASGKRDGDTDSATSCMTRSQLARISHTAECIGAANQRKPLCCNDFRRRAERPDADRVSPGFVWICTR